MNVRRAVRGSVLLASLVAAGACAAAGKAYVGNFKDDSVSVVDIETATVTGVIPVAAGPHGMAATRDGRRVFVGGDGSSEVDVIDTASARVAGRIEIGRSPHGLALMSDGRTLLVGVYGEDRVAFVDVSGDTPTVRASVPVAKPHTIAIRPDGRLAYVASQEPGQFALVVVDLDARAVVKRIALEQPPRDLEFAFDGRALYFTQAGVDAVQVLDPSTDAIVARIPTGASPHIASVFRGAPAGTAVVQGPGQVLLFDPATHAALRSIAVGRQPHWIAAADDGRTALVTNEGSNDVSVIDLGSGAVRNVAVGRAPRKVVVVDAAGASSTTKVSIARFAFTPATRTVPVGTQVEWSNDDAAPHGLAHADGAPGQDLLLPGERTTRRYEAVGRYDYVCSVHPFMHGTIEVVAAETGR